MGIAVSIGRWIAASVLLGACTPDAPAPANSADNQAGAASDAVSPAPARAVGADSPLRDWIVGTWSFDTGCATDFLIRYEADGKLDNAGEVGSWTVDGDQVTEIVTERLDNGGEAPARIDPPIRRTYSVARTDADHGTITFEKRTVPILRC